MPTIDQITDDLQSVESLIVVIGAREGLRPHWGACIPAVGAQKAIREHDDLVAPDRKRSHRKARDIIL
jgi:hypothetical protein